MKNKITDAIERKTMQDIKDYVQSLDTPENKVYQENSLLIMSCFSKAMEFIEDNAKLRQPPVSGSLPIEEVALHAADDWFDIAKFRSDVKADLKSYYEGYRDAMGFCQGNDH